MSHTQETPKLNAAQREAAEHGQGPLLVLSGAGSGKTRVIIHRIAHLIRSGVDPGSILAVSFTNKAAREMADRLAHVVGERAAHAVWLSTFHSFGVRFLGEEAEALGRGRRFVIFDQGDSVGLIRELLRGELSGRRLDAGAVASRISLWKNRFLAPDEVPHSDQTYDAAARAVFADYETRLQAMRAVDFDDLVVAPVRILRDSPAIRDKWRHRFEHLLVDEFQDTNPAQLELVRLLANEQGNVCVVGDDDQAIYGWRGADVENVLHFDRHFPQTRIVKLEANYRSRTPVLRVANAAIAQADGKRHVKTLQDTRGQGPPVQLWTAQDESSEARSVAREIRRLLREHGARGRDIGVLYRSAAQARPVEEELRVAGVAYRVYGGTQLFDRKEVKDAIAYLRVVVNPRDELSLRRIINHPARGIGDTTIERLAAHARSHGIPLTRALASADDVEALPASARQGARSLAAALDRAREQFRRGESLAHAARQLFTAVGLRDELTPSDADAQRATRWDNVESLLRSLERFEAREDDGNTTILQFLTQMTLRPDGGGDARDDRVTLSTLHAAKGLEFDHVFLLGCVEGRIPHARVLDPKSTEAAPTGVDEERRLFYVGVTRARERLYLLRPEHRQVRGRTMQMAPSRFLEGLPDEALEHKRVEGEQSLDNDELADMTRALLDRLRS